MLMYSKDGGFHNFSDENVEQAKKDGWIEGQPVRVALLAEKHAPTTFTLKEPATITIHEPEPPRRGRPRKIATDE